MWREISNFPKLDLSMYITDDRYKFLTIDRDERFVKMRHEMPFFADKFSVFKFNPKEIWDIHIDASFDNSRISTLNFPLYEMPFRSRTNFYRFTKEPFVINRVPGKYTVYDRGSCERVGSMVLTGPTVINVMAPHDVENLEERPRYVLSWSSKLPWQETGRLVQEWASTQTLFT